MSKSVLLFLITESPPPADWNFYGSLRNFGSDQPRISSSRIRTLSWRLKLQVWQSKIPPTLPLPKLVLFMEGLETLGLTSGEPIPLELEPLIQDLETLGLTSQEYPHPVLELIMEDLEDILFAMVEWSGTPGRYSGSIHTPIHHTNFRSDYPKFHRPPPPRIGTFHGGFRNFGSDQPRMPPSRIGTSHRVLRIFRSD